MSYQAIARRITSIATQNSPSILTAIGVAGTIITAYLSGRAAVNASNIIADYSPLNGTPLEKKRVAELVWKEFIPPVVTGCVTITCIIMANRVGSRKIAALAAAYSLSEKGFSEYKDKVAEKFGKGKEQAVRDSVAQDQVDRKPASNEVILAAGGSQLFMDSWSGRYFLSDMESVRKAVNDVNQSITNEFAVPVSEFYDRIGLPRTDSSEELGWNIDEFLEVDYSAVIGQDSKAVIVITFKTKPRANYYKHA